MGEGQVRVVHRWHMRTQTHTTCTHTHNTHTIHVQLRIASVHCIVLDLLPVLHPLSLPPSPSSAMVIRHGIKDPNYTLAYKQADIDRGFPEVYPHCEVQCAECLNQSQRMGFVYDGLPRVTIFRSALSPHVPPMTDWFGSRGPPPNFPGQKNRAIAAIEDSKEKKTYMSKDGEPMAKVEVTFGHPMDPMAIQRVFKTLQKLDIADKTGEKYDPHCFEDVPTPRRNYDIPLPDGRKMYFESIKPNGYMAVRIERPVEGSRK